MDLDDKVKLWVQLRCAQDQVLWAITALFYAAMGLIAVHYTKPEYNGALPLPLIGASMALFCFWAQGRALNRIRYYEDSIWAAEKGKDTTVLPPKGFNHRCHESPSSSCDCHCDHYSAREVILNVTKLLMIAWLIVVAFEFLPVPSPINPNP